MPSWFGMVTYASSGTLGDPVVAADGFKPPDLIHIGEGDAVHLVRAVLFEQRAETCHAFTGGLDVRQHEGEEVLFANAAGTSGS